MFASSLTISAGFSSLLVDEPSIFCRETSAGPPCVWATAGAPAKVQVSTGTSLLGPVVEDVGGYHTVGSPSGNDG